MGGFTPQEQAKSDAADSSELQGAGAIARAAADSCLSPTLAIRIARDSFQLALEIHFQMSYRYWPSCNEPNGNPEDFHSPDTLHVTTTPLEDSSSKIKCR
jgi:hypothetical protein